MAHYFDGVFIERFIEAEEESAKGVLDLEPILNAVDYDRIFQALIGPILKSGVRTTIIATAIMRFIDVSIQAKEVKLLIYSV